MPDPTAVTSVVTGYLIMRGPSERPRYVAKLLHGVGEVEWTCDPAAAIRFRDISEARYVRDCIVSSIAEQPAIPVKV